MEWLELTIKSASAGIELLETALTAYGYDSFIVEDAEEFQTFLENNRDYWDVVETDLAEKMQSLSQVRLYLENDGRAMERIAGLRSLLADLKQRCPDADLGSLDLSMANVRDEDWENTWKQYYRPIPIGERLLVIPQWIRDTDPDGRIPVLLDPGMIFGTGAHASTQMCMERLETLIRGGEQVLDLGSGSGILSITALCLGAAHATGVDVDPKAEDVARENAAFNGIGADRFTAVTGNVVTEQDALSDLFSKTYDVVCLNIFADVIIPIAPILPRFMGPRSTVLCSGILAPRLPDVCEALHAAGLRVLTQEVREDWCCVTAKLS